MHSLASCLGRLSTVHFPEGYQCREGLSYDHVYFGK